MDPTCVARDDASAPRKAGSDAQVMKKVGGARFFGFSDGSCARCLGELLTDQTDLTEG